MNELGRRLGGFILDLFQTVVLALSIFMVSYLFLFQPHQVKGSSMYPNFHDNDFLLTDKISYKFSEPERGDVVIFKAPPSEPCADTECEYIKRIIGLPRETLRVFAGNIYVDEKMLDEKYLPNNLQTNDGNYFQEGLPITLSDDEYLLLGDNRSYSRDGREFGPIQKKAIIGKAWLRYWPIQSGGLIPEVKY